MRSTGIQGLNGREEYGSQKCTIDPLLETGRPVKPTRMPMERMVP